MPPSSYFKQWPEFPSNVLEAGIENVEANWRYVRPEPGCVIVLIGDTLVEWTAGALRASIHRVVTAPGKRAAATRLGLGYFLRPSHTTRMSRLISDNGTLPILALGEAGDERGVAEWAQCKANGDVAAAVEAAGKGK
ncbi:putative 2og-fe oxygenase protein [Botrytis fragariae]|uniref:Putative 2og-fe oxygenase protein n=1 Tax=Botrytis fragariae TaxID=1964551 RepID=A0A8H6AMJ5_9HELO|nr:putative 2og-fe oxygenase protein [Botrytis fragariae]KAF5870124.1 putative 2og-fe oxygenase protein [Botrytis fragariae]